MSHDKNPFRQPFAPQEGILAIDRTTTWLEGISHLDSVSSNGGIDDTSIMASEENNSVSRGVSTSDYSTSTVTGVSTSRVYINLPNGSRILVPISASATVSDLHVEAVRRATKFGVSCTIDGTLLQTVGRNAAIVFDEDYLTDVLTATDNDTFTLHPSSSSFANDFQIPAVPPSTIGSSINLSSVALPTTPQAQKRSKKIYVRWITPVGAMNNSCLRDIEVDPVPVPSNILLSDLRETAYERLYRKPWLTETDNRTTDLYLAYSHLSEKSQEFVTLNDLELEGSRKHPLNIFVILGRKPGQTQPHKPEDICGYDCSERGVATFVTSLSIMISEIEKGRVSLENLLELLWEITHFPPAVIALRLFYEQGSHINAGAMSSRELSALSECFREIAFRMVPLSISPERVLEASRQIFGWLYSLRSEASLSSHGSQTLVHQFELLDLSRPENRGLTGMFDHNVPIELPTRDGNANGSRREILVSLQNLDHVPARALAFASNGLEGRRRTCYYFHIPNTSRSLLGHKRSATLHSGDFGSLLETSNQIHAFKMVGPSQLIECTSESLPIITLDGDGYVSTYEQRDAACGEREFCTWNCIKGRKQMPETNPGQYLLQKLEPIIAERKQNGTCEFDASTTSGVDYDTTEPAEAVIICVDLSGSMNEEMKVGWIENSNTGAPSGLSGNDRLTRLNEAQEAFRNLVSRISAHSLPTHMGLVTFSSNTNVTISQPLTPVLLNFQYHLDNIRAGGQTALWNGINKAAEMLISFKVRHPDIKCRIVALTDGKDNHSSITAPQVCSKLYNNDIVLDAIVIGTDSTHNLFKIAKHTGGYAFCPKSRSALFQISLLETFIDISTRPDITKVPITDWFTSEPKQADMNNPYSFPRCRPHPNNNDNFLSLRDANRFLSRHSTNTSSSASTISGSTSGRTEMSGTTAGTSGSSRYILAEMKAMITNQHEYMDIYISESNIGFWKVVMQGPPASPYQDGSFLLYIEIGDSFPRKAPTARFVTPILHPNITKHGRICHPIFDREWTPTIRIYDVLNQIWGILMSLEPRDAVDPLFTLRFWTDYESGRREVEEYVRHFATDSLAVHRARILGLPPQEPAPPAAAPPMADIAPKIPAYVPRTSLAAHFRSRRTPAPAPAPAPNPFAASSSRTLLPTNYTPSVSSQSTTSASSSTSTSMSMSQSTGTGAGSPVSQTRTPAVWSVPEPVPMLAPAPSPLPRPPSVTSSNANARSEVSGTNQRSSLFIRGIFGRKVPLEKPTVLE